MSLLSRIRPNVEAAPWVCEEIARLEAERDALARRVTEMERALSDTLSIASSYLGSAVGTGAQR